MTDNQEFFKKPFVKKFSDKGQYFVYDVNTNQIIEVEEPVYDIIDMFEEDNSTQLETIFKNTYTPATIRHFHSEIKSARAEHGLFSTFRLEKNTMGIRNIDELKIVQEHGFQQLLLELTKNCNLNCAYCFTSGKYFKDKSYSLNMDMTTCKKALDFFHTRSDQSSPPTITFYGGEPLLRFDIIRDAVAYIQSKPGGHRYKFNLTTNGTTLNWEHLNFFIRHDFGLMVSLDGPQSVNDRYRVFKNGKGTYNRIMKTLDLIKANDKEYFKKKIGISSVLTPPYNEVEKILDFFTTHETIKDIKEKIRSSGVNTNGTSFLEDFDLVDKISGIKDVEKIFTDRIKKAILENDLDSLTIEKKKLFFTLYNIAKRQIKGVESYIHPLGSCHIGVRRLFVDVNGNFNICERASDKYRIGSLAKGFNYKNMVRYYMKFEEQMEECNNCWALLHCDRCWASIGYVDDFSGQRKDEFCNNSKRIILNAFKLYTRLLREAPDCLKSLEYALEEGI